VIATIPVPDAGPLASSIRFCPDGRRFAILWYNGRIDMFEPEALRQELSKRGLAWQEPTTP